MIKYNPQYKSDGTENGALTSAPSGSIVFDVPGKAIWVKGVKLLGTDHTYAFDHDTYINLTNTPGTPEDIKIGININTLKAAIDTTYDVVTSTVDGLAPKFNNTNSADAAASTSYRFLGLQGSTLKWYTLPHRNIYVENTEVLSVDSTNPLKFVAGTGIQLTWDSTNKRIQIVNSSPDLNHNTDYQVGQYLVSDNSDYRLLFKRTANDTEETGSARYASTILYNPSTKQLKIDGSKVITVVDIYSGATASDNATTGLVPAATSAQRTYFLKGDGTWANIATEMVTANTWRPIKVNSSEKLGSGTDTGAVDFVAGTGITLGWDATNKKITITNSAPDVNHNTDRTGIKLAAVTGTKKTDDTVILANSAAGLNIQGGTNKFSIGDGTNYIEVPITPSFTVTDKAASILTSATTLATINGTDITAKVTVVDSSPTLTTSLKTIATIAGVEIKAKITNYNTDENVKQTPKTDNVNRPLMMINGGTSTGELTSTSMFSTSIYANASTNMIISNGYIKAGYDDNSVLLAGGGAKALSDFAMADAYLPLAGGWMDTDAIINFRGKNSTTSAWGKIGYMATSPNGFKMHLGSDSYNTKALYICSNGYDAGNDNGGIAIDNDGVTAFGAGDTGSVFRVLNEDNVNDGPLFYVTKASGAVTKRLHTANNFVSIVETGTLPYACTSTTLNTNLNADLLDSLHASQFVRYYNNIDISIDTLTDEAYILTNAANGNGWTSKGTKPTGSHDGVGILNFHTHKGNYYTLLAVDTKNNHLWIRSAENSTTFGDWVRILKVGDVINYYWANLNVLDLLLTDTTPLFGRVGIGAAVKTGGDGLLNFPRDNVAINFRLDSGCYSKIEYMSLGNEALVFANQYATSSFIFKTNYNLGNTNDWRETNIGTPAVLIKSQSLYVNCAIGNGVTPGYNFYVGGTGRISGDTYINPGLLYITKVYDNVEKTIRIGAANSSWYHFNASDASPFYFSNNSAFNGTVYPYSNDSFDLGTTSNKWKTLFISNYIDMNGHGYLRSGNASSFNYSYTFKDDSANILGDNANSMGMFSGPGGEEGAIIVSPDTCIIYNSSDTGWNFAVHDKDLGGNLIENIYSSDNSFPNEWGSKTRTFGIRQTSYVVYSRGGFQKRGSSDSFVLLGGGGHKAISDFKIGDYLPLAGGWMDTDAQVCWKGINGSTSVYTRMGYNSYGPVHASGGANATKGFYIWSNGYDSSNDWGGIAIDNEGVTVFGAGDAQSNFTGVFRVFNEDNIGAGPMFIVTKTGRGTFIENVYAAHFYENSDARLKHDIVPISKSIKQFKFHNDERIYYGFIALELEILHPELVDSSQEYKKVNYDSAICYYIANLENKVQELENKLKILENRLT